MTLGPRIDRRHAMQNGRDSSCPATHGIDGDISPSMNATRVVDGVRSNITLTPYRRPLELQTVTPAGHGPRYIWTLATPATRSSTAVGFFSQGLNAHATKTPSARTSDVIGPLTSTPLSSSSVSGRTSTTCPERSVAVSTVSALNETSRTLRGEARPERLLIGTD